MREVVIIATKEFGHIWILEKIGSIDSLRTFNSMDIPGAPVENDDYFWGLPFNVVYFSPDELSAYIYIYECSSYHEDTENSNTIMFIAKISDSDYNLIFNDQDDTNNFAEYIARFNQFNPDTERYVSSEDYTGSFTRSELEGCLIKQYDQVWEKMSPEYKENVLAQLRINVDDQRDEIKRKFLKHCLEDFFTLKNTLHLEIAFPLDITQNNIFIRHVVYDAYGDRYILENIIENGIYKRRGMKLYLCEEPKIDYKEGLRIAKAIDEEGNLFKLSWNFFYKDVEDAKDVIVEVYRDEEV